MHAWQAWLVAALLLFVAEMAAPGFWLLSVAVGCLAAGLVSLVAPGVLVPVLSFAAGTLLSLVGIRPFLLRYLHPRSSGIRTNVDALPRAGVDALRHDPQLAGQGIHVRPRAGPGRPRGRRPARRGARRRARPLARGVGLPGRSWARPATLPSLRARPSTLALERQRDERGCAGGQAGDRVGAHRPRHGEGPGAGGG